MPINKSTGFAKKGLICLLGLVFSGVVSAGFLEMPDIEEVPEAENDILLEDLDIPNVRERNPNPEAGPRLNVRSFRVQGIVEFPELGITRETLIKLVENIRFDIMKEGDRTEHGYTMEELAELQDIIAEIEKDTRGEHVTQYDVQKLVFLIREQRRKRGVTLGMLELVADQITDYYRQRGFILARAFIPEQHVRDGVVTITLLLGNLGEVALENNTRYSQGLIENVFSDAIGKPVTASNIEEKLYHVNDMPGISVQGFFSPGTQVGDTKLSVNVLNEKLFSSNVRIDNHGSESTGTYRLYADFHWNSPLKYGDKLSIAALYAAEPETSTYGSIRYGGPFFSYRWAYDIGLSQNAYITGIERTVNPDDPDQEAAISEVGGTANTIDLSLRYKLSRSRVNSTSMGLRLSQVKAVIEIKNGAGEILNEGTNDDTVHNADLFYNFDFVNERRRSIHNGSVTIVSTRLVDTGETVNQEDSTNPFLGGDGASAGGEFEDTQFLKINYSYLKFFRFPFTQTDVRGKLTLQAQYAGKALSSVNQSSLGGPAKARAFSTGVFFGDDSAVGSAELVLKRYAPYKGIGVQPYFYFDAAYGAKFIVGESEPQLQEQISGVGAGVNFDFPVGLAGNLTLGVPTNEARNEDQRDDYKIYASLQYAF